MTCGNLGVPSASLIVLDRFPFFVGILFFTSAGNSSQRLNIVSAGSARGCRAATATRVMGNCGQLPSASFRSAFSLGLKRGDRYSLKNDVTSPSKSLNRAGIDRPLLNSSQNRELMI